MAEISTVFRISFQHTPAGVTSFCTPHHPEIAAELVSLRTQVKLRKYGFFCIDQSADQQPRVSKGSHLGPRWAYAYVFNLVNRGALDLFHAHSMAEHAMSTTVAMRKIGDEFVRHVKDFRILPTPFPITSDEILQAPVHLLPDGEPVTHAGISITEQGVKLLVPGVPSGLPFEELIAARIRERAMETVNERFRRDICQGFIN